MYLLRPQFNLIVRVAVWYRSIAEPLVVTKSMQEAKALVQKIIAALTKQEVLAAIQTYTVWYFYSIFIVNSNIIF